MWVGVKGVFRGIRVLLKGPGHSITICASVWVTLPPVHNVSKPKIRGVDILYSVDEKGHRNRLYDFFAV
uniref:Uncharacterized protein n=1 Tax=Labrus bergylta TaxID=56723 RepID=A0A3Q3GC86_9LABR